MAKRNKMKSLLEETPTAAEESIEQESDLNEEALASSSIVGNGKLTAEGKEKLEKYEALEQSVSALTQENEMLKAKVTEYVEKLAASDTKKLEDELNDLKKKLEEAKSYANEVGSLQKKVKELRDEADGYLMKISDLTFENANLTCQLNEAASKSAGASTHAPNMHTSQGLARPRRDVYNPYKNNGYGTW